MDRSKAPPDIEPVRSVWVNSTDGNVLTSWTTVETRLSKPRSELLFFIEIFTACTSVAWLDPKDIFILMMIVELPYLLCRSTKDLHASALH